jgi:hypothetical protein
MYRVIWESAGLLHCVRRLSGSDARNLAISLHNSGFLSLVKDSGDITVLSLYC